MFSEKNIYSHFRLDKSQCALLAHNKNPKSTSAPPPNVRLLLPDGTLLSCKKTVNAPPASRTVQLLLPVGVERPRLDNPTAMSNQSKTKAEGQTLPSTIMSGPPSSAQRKTSESQAK